MSLEDQSVPTLSLVPETQFLSWSSCHRTSPSVPVIFDTALFKPHDHVFWCNIITSSFKPLPSCDYSDSVCFLAAVIGQLRELPCNVQVTSYLNGLLTAAPGTSTCEGSCLVVWSVMFCFGWKLRVWTFAIKWPLKALKPAPGRLSQTSVHHLTMGLLFSFCIWFSP